jgi:PPE-repeat protein
MSRTSALVAIAVALAFAGPIAPSALTQEALTKEVLAQEVLAQLVPPAGSAGAGSSAISGVPFGPANPSVLSDPSGIGNAGRMAPLGTNAPAPPTSYGSLSSSPPSASPSRVVTPSYTNGSTRFSARNVEPRRPGIRRRGRPQTSSFTGICRGC